MHVGSRLGLVKDEGGGSQGTKVGSPGDELTGNKVGQMGGGTIINGKGDINKQVGIMRADNTHPSEKHNPVPGAKPSLMVSQAHGFPVSDGQRTTAKETSVP